MRLLAWRVVNKTLKLSLMFLILCETKFERLIYDMPDKQTYFDNQECYLSLIGFKPLLKRLIETQENR